MFQEDVEPKRVITDILGMIDSGPTYGRVVLVAYRQLDDEEVIPTEMIPTELLKPTHEYRKVFFHFETRIVKINA
jgi:hypothetical protein